MNGTNTDPDLETGLGLDPVTPPQMIPIWRKRTSRRMMMRNRNQAMKQARQSRFPAGMQIQTPKRTSICWILAQITTRPPLRLLSSSLTFRNTSPILDTKRRN